MLPRAPRNMYVCMYRQCPCEEVEPIEGQASPGFARPQGGSTRRNPSGSADETSVLSRRVLISTTAEPLVLPSASHC